MVMASNMDKCPQRTGVKAIHHCDQGGAYPQRQVGEIDIAQHGQFDEVGLAASDFATIIDARFRVFGGQLSLTDDRTWDHIGRIGFPADDQVVDHIRAAVIQAALKGLFDGSIGLLGITLQIVGSNDDGRDSGRVHCQ